MIPLELQDALLERVKDEIKNLLLKNINNERVPVKVFPQHLPNKSKTGNEDTDPYPCIIVRLATGNKSDENENGITVIQFIIGTVDRDSDNQGYRDAITVANKISENLQRNPMIKGKYELTLPINWAYSDEDAEPYYFTGFETIWKTPSYLREDVEALI